MKDVAALAGVSPMTVSRVLNDRKNVTDDLRRRVSSAVEELGYERSELARALKYQRSHQIGVVLPSLIDPVFAACVNAISSVASLHDYSVAVSLSHERLDLEFKEALRMLYRGVDGLLLFPTQSRAEPTLLLAPALRSLPVVTIAAELVDSDFDSVRADNRNGTQIGTEHLVRLGHRRIIFVRSVDDTQEMSLRYSGYSCAMKTAELQERVVVLSETSTDSMAVLRKLLGGPEAPTAALCADGRTTGRVLRSLHQRSNKSVRELDLVGFDECDRPDVLLSSMTVIRQPVERLAQIATSLLVERIEKQERSGLVHRIVVPAELIARDRHRTLI